MFPHLSARDINDTPFLTPVEIIELFLKLKQELVEIDTKIQNTESEISRLRGIV